MRPDRPEPGSPAAWLQHARSDLVVARSNPGEPLLWETLCYHTQQAVEKSIKAVLVHRGADLPRIHDIIHDIAKLIRLLARTGAPLSEELEPAADLTEYAVSTRYPGWYEPPTEDERDEAVDLAQRVHEWARRQIEGEEAGE